MWFRAWAFSATRAWQRPFFRWSSIATVSYSLVASGYFLYQVLTHMRDGGNVILHYSVYLGVDDIRPWYWAFLWPALWIIGVMIDFVIAFGVYRVDPLCANALAVLAVAWSVPWSIALYHLSLINS